MADGIELNPGTGGANIMTDDDGSKHWQYVKMAWGANNTQNIVGSISSNPLPVALSATDNAVLDTIAGAVSGTEMQVDIVAALPAGSNAIGKLAANSGVDIGDVDVTSLPAELSGPGSPSIDSYTSAAINVATGANNSIISAPGASKQIWVYGLALTADVAGSFSMQDEDDTALTGVMPVAATGGFVMPPSGNFAMPWFKVATNKALEIDAVTCTADGIVTYAIVSV